MHFVRRDMYRIWRIRFLSVCETNYNMTGYISDDMRPITVQRILKMKSEGKKISMLTSYDYTMASIVDSAGVDMILIGDSASNVMAGNETTLPITLDEMIYHAKSVVKAAKHALVVCDMPFGSYQVSADEAVRNAIRIMKESGCDAVKLEGGKRLVPAISAMVDAGVPVVGHLGLTPQSIHKFGGYGLRAKEEEEAERLLADAQALQDAGCFALVLEKIPASLAAINIFKKPLIFTSFVVAGSFTLRGTEPSAASCNTYSIPSTAFRQSSGFRISPTINLNCIG